MKIKERPSVSMIPISQIPIGGCFKHLHKYWIRTDVSHIDISDNLIISVVDLSTGVESTLYSDIEVYAVDAVITINKVGVIDDTSE